MMLERGCCVFDANRDYIGGGAYGRVYKATWQGGEIGSRYGLKDGDLVAAKVLNTTLNPNDVFADNREALLLSELAHQNVVKFFGICHTEQGQPGAPAGQLMLVTEFCSGLSLYHHLQNPGSVKHPARTLSWALNIAEGLKYLHEGANRPIVHRDLKSQNVLISAGPRGHVLKICDFGSSVHMDRTHGGAHTLLSGPIGTEKWMAPEMLRSGFGGATIDEPRKCDIYSCGVVLWELVTHEEPFKDVKGSILWLVGSGKLSLTVPIDTPPAMKDLLNACFDFEPEHRPTASDIAIAVTGMQRADPSGQRIADFVSHKSDWIEDWRSQKDADYDLAQQKQREEDDFRARADAAVGALATSQNTNTFLRFCVVGLFAVIFSLLQQPQDADTQRAASKVFREVAGVNEVMTLTELESGLTKLVRREVLSKSTIDDVVRIFESYNWNEAGDHGLDEFEFLGAVANENSPYGFMRRYLSWALRLVGLEGSLGSFLRHLPMAYGRATVGAVGLPILGLSLLLFYKLSRTMRGFVPQSRDEFGKLLFALLLGPVGALLLATALIDEVSGFAVAYAALVIIMTLWLAFVLLVPAAAISPSTPSSMSQRPSRPASRAISRTSSSSELSALMTQHRAPSSR